MNKQSKKHYICNSCGAVSLKWSGKCVDCNQWGTILEDIQNEAEIISCKGNILITHGLSGNIEEIPRIPTSISELDRVLGGGVVQGSAILVGGDPGIGKSTLLLQLAAILSSNGVETIYITGEESINQIKMRAFRLNITNSPLTLLSATNLNDIIATIDSAKQRPDVVIIDSIQTIYSEEIGSSPGTVSQVKYASNQLILYGKKHNITFFLVGHVTKEGQIAGPKVLEHMVDTVLYFEGDNNLQFRILRAVKNRFGGVNEIGVFEMRAEGLVEINNPSEIFLMERSNTINGISVFAGVEGSRPILVEVQALTSKSFLAMPKRTALGFDHNRLSMIIAVMAVRYGLNLSGDEVYLSIAGGMRISDPSIDLAVASALISAKLGFALPQRSVFFGEIGLSGEVRRTAMTEARLNESIKLGYEQIFCYPHKNIDLNKITPVQHIQQLKQVSK